MLVDDERIDLTLYKRILKRSNLVEDIVTFSYATDALRYLEDPASPEVDLILLDINMPAMSGFEFLEAAAQHLPPANQAPVIIMLTTSLNPRDRAMAESFEAVKAYINKPFESEHLDVLADALAASL